MKDTSVNLKMPITGTNRQWCQKIAWSNGTYVPMQNKSLKKFNEPGAEIYFFICYK